MPPSALFLATALVWLAAKGRAKLYWDYAAVKAKGGESVAPGPSTGATGGGAPLLKAPSLPPLVSSGGSELSGNFWKNIWDASKNGGQVQ